MHRKNCSGEWPITAVYYAPDYYGSGQYAAYFAMIDGYPWTKRASVGKPELVVNPAEAAIYAKALASSGEAADAAYADLADEMMQDTIILPLVSPDLVLAHRSDIAGVRYSACCNLPLAVPTRK